MEEFMMTKEETTRWHWESHYKITLEDGVWQALPMGNSVDILTADTPMRLRDAMKDHFAGFR